MAVAILLLVVAVLLALAAVVVRSKRARVEPGARTAGPARTQALGPRVRAIFERGGEEKWDSLEELLVRADAGPGLSRDIVTRVRERYSPGDDPAELLADEITTSLGGETGLRYAKSPPSVFMIVGVNGSGKTTTVGKLAAMLADSGMKVSMAACDTFRAAAGEQLEVWAQRSGAHLIPGGKGADPGAVAFDAIRSARARGDDVLLVDTAGRLHTRTPLMDELRKVKRVLEKASERVDEVVLVLDATTGQNGISQARAFTDAVGVTGIALAKLDGTARGGIVLAVREELGVPVKIIGTGEGPDDIELFDSTAFAKRLVS